MKLKNILIPAISILSFFIVITAFSLLNTKTTYKYIKDLKYNKAATTAKEALLAPKIISALTLQKIPIIEIWKTSLEITVIIPKIIEDITNLDQQRNNSILLFSKKLNYITKNTNNSWIIKKELGEEKYNNATKLLSDANLLIQYITQPDLNYIITLQNSHEIRATGGFMGSFAHLNIKNGAINNINFQDIYEPDGQFEGYIEAPDGVKQYLSSGKGMRLPDANWYPDFPSSARTILDYFALGNKKSIDGLVAINLETIENFLKITGSIDLIDYNVVITSDNLSTIARKDRDKFFPGSKQKSNFFSALFNQLKFKLTTFSPQQQKEFIKQIILETNNKNIQIYSNQENIENILKSYKLAGELTKKTNPDRYFYLIESNVGINKANPAVTRKVTINLGKSMANLIINFNNHNYPPKDKNDNPYLKQADHLGYVNYQRIIMDTDIEINSIYVDKKLIENWHETTIKSSSGELFKQIGLLITVPEQQSKNFTINFHYTKPIEKKPTIVIQKQSGLSPTEYTIIYQDQINNFLLKKDEIIKFE